MSEPFAKTIVSLYDTKKGALCTGSILSQSIILTAAHCLVSAPEAIVVIFGQDIRGQDRQLRRVTAYMISPYYESRQNAGANTGDIAVVKFAGGLPAGYKPAEVLTDSRALLTGAKVVLAGYGMADGITKGGSGVLRYTVTTIEHSAFSVSEVAINQKQGSGACHGDSGGPGYVVVNGQLKLFGVTSRSFNDAGDTCMVNSVYTVVPFYSNWISQASLHLITGGSGQNVASR